MFAAIVYDTHYKQRTMQVVWISITCNILKSLYRKNS